MKYVGYLVSQATLGHMREFIVQVDLADANLYSIRVPTDFGVKRVVHD